MCEVKRLILRNSMSEKLCLCLREYRQGDEEGIISCIREEYEDTYFKKDFYNPAYLSQETKKGTSTFLVAETQRGEIAGIFVLKQFYPKESMCELATMIFKKEYRGYGLAEPFFRFGMEIALAKHYSAIFCLPVLFHSITQRLLHRLGLRAAGLVLNVFDVTQIQHSYQNGNNIKHSMGIQVMAAGKKDAGRLYLPEEHIAFCRKIYDRLEVTYEIGTEKEKGSEAWSGESVMEWKYDKNQSSLEIRIHKIGKDLGRRMERLLYSFPLIGRRTANIFLNINDSSAEEAYACLSKKGWFFTGLKPLCSEAEYMVLHQAGDVDIYFKDYVVSREFEELLSYTEKEYEKRKKTYNRAENYRFSAACHKSGSNSSGSGRFMGAADHEKYFAPKQQ